MNLFHTSEYIIKTGKDRERMSTDFDLEKAAAVHDVRGITVLDDGDPLYAAPIDGTYQLFRDGEQVTDSNRGLCYPVNVSGTDTVVAMYMPSNGLTDNDIARISLVDGTLETIFDGPLQCRFLRPNPTDPERIAFIHSTAEGMSIREVDARSEEVTTLAEPANDEGWISAFAWSPSGTELVFQDGPPYGNSKLRVLNEEVASKTSSSSPTVVQRSVGWRPVSSGLLPANACGLRRESSLPGGTRHREPRCRPTGRRLSMARRNGVRTRAS